MTKNDQNLLLREPRPIVDSTWSALAPAVGAKRGVAPWMGWHAACEQFCPLSPCSRPLSTASQLPVRPTQSGTRAADLATKRPERRPNGHLQHFHPACEWEMRERQLCYDLCLRRLGKEAKGTAQSAFRQHVPILAGPGRDAVGVAIWRVPGDEQGFGKNKVRMTSTFLVEMKTKDRPAVQTIRLR